MNLYEKYKDDIEAQNFIWYCDKRIGSTEEEIDDAITKIRRHMSLQDALNVLYGIYDCYVDDSFKKLNELNK